MKVKTKHNEQEWIDEELRLSVSDDIILLDEETSFEPRDHLLKPILTYSKLSSRDVLTLLLNEGASHIVERRPDDFKNEVHIASTMLDNPQAFFSSPEQVLFGNHLEPAKIELGEFWFKRFSEKPQILKSVRDFLTRSNISRLPMDFALRVIDELVMNAVLDAPPSFQGQFGESEYDKNEVDKFVQAEPSKAIVALHEDWIWVGCEDLFGTLLPQRVLLRILDSYRRGVASVMRLSEKGGAGIGYRMMFDLCTSVYFGVHENKKTVVYFKFPLKKSRRELYKYGKNIHFLYYRDEVSASISYFKNKKEHQTELEFFGYINENMPFSEIKIDTDELVVNFQGVTGINSVGVRAWMNFIQGLAVTKVSFVKCPECIVEQFNLVYGFLPKNSYVESVYIPYYCDSCNVSTFRLYDFVQNLSDEVKCVSCDKNCEMDVLENEFLSFNLKKAA